jgi:1-acyl-sn-glycerol-3-phosphate acyltransferase
MNVGVSVGGGVMGTILDQNNQTGQIEEPEKKAETKKPAKNLYEPYSTPRIAWEVVRVVVQLIFFLWMRGRLRGRYNVPRKGPYIIAANHLSWLDIPFVPAFVPGKVSYMAKEELFHGKMGWLVRFLGAFPVKRGERDRQAIQAADQQLKQQKTFIIFPEGTRSKTHTMTKGNPGLGMIALRAGVPVVPVAIWGSEAGLKKFGAKVIISYGEPLILKPKGKKITREDIQESTDEVMKRIAAMLPASYRGVYGEQVESNQ